MKSKAFVPVIWTNLSTTETLLPQTPLETHGTDPANKESMKKITLENIVPKARKYNRVQGIAPTNSQGVYNAEIIPGDSVRIYGTMTNHVKGPQAFDKTFKVGDKAEYASFNLIYVGTIVRIGPKTVTVKHYAHSATVTQLEIFGFVDKNWNFDEEKINRENAIESQCL